MLVATLLSACQPAPAEPLPTATMRVQPTVPPTEPPARQPVPTSAPAPATRPPTAAAAPTAAPQPTPQPQTGLLLRSAAEAERSQAQRLSSQARPASPSDLDKVLKTPLSESSVGLVNGHHLLETEFGETPHFSYALNPLYNEATDGRQRFLVFGNSPNFLNYRLGALEEAALRNSDRAIWAARNDVRVATVLQVDNELSDALVREIVGSRAKAGLRVFVMGNEFNDPGAQWRYNVARLLRLLEVAKDTLKDLGVRDGEVYTPSVAFIESARHLDDLLTQASNAGGSLPADGVSENFYGSVGMIRDHLAGMRDVLKKHRLEKLHYRISELGSPTDTYHQAFADEQLAYNYFPQAIAAAMSTDQVDALDIYSTFEFGRDRYSLTYLEGATLKPKPSLLAVVQAARVFSRVKDVEYEADGDVQKVVVERSDGIKLWVVWSSADDREVAIRKPDGAAVFGALGNRLQEERIVLTPRPHATLAGTAKYIVLGR